MSAGTTSGMRLSSDLDVEGGRVGDRVTTASVTVIAGLIVALAFVFGFGNVWSLALRLGVPGGIAPLVAPAVDLSVLALLIAVRHLAMHGVSRRELAPARRLLVASCLTTLALNVAEPMINGEYGRAAFDCVGPLLLIGWSHVGPELLGAIHLTRSHPGGRSVEVAGVEACSTATVGSAAAYDGYSESVVEPLLRVAPAATQQWVDQPLLSAARQIDADHWAENGRPASAETLRRHLRVGSVTARKLKDQVRANLPSVMDDLARSVGVSC